MVLSASSAIGSRAGSAAVMAMRLGLAAVDRRARPSRHSRPTVWLSVDCRLLHHRRDRRADPGDRRSRSSPTFRASTANAAYNEFERGFLRLRHHGAAVDEPLPWRSPCPGGYRSLSGVAVGLIIEIAYRSVRIPAPAGTRSVTRLWQPAGGVLGLLVLPRHVGRDRVLRSPLGADLPRAGRRPVEYHGGRCLRRVLAGHARSGERREAGWCERFGLSACSSIALVVTAAGFLLYWGTRDPYFVVPGLFVIGLGVALLYPLALGLAVSAAGAHGDAASARVMIAVGLAILIMPATLGESGRRGRSAQRAPHAAGPHRRRVHLLCRRPGPTAEGGDCPA